MWRVEVRQNVVKNKWNEVYGTYVYFEFYYVLAYRGNECYLHSYEFADDYDKAARLVKKILSSPNFSPRNKPGIWYSVVDAKPVRPRRKQIRIK